MEIRENSTFEAWKKALKFIISEGTEFKDREERTCREVPNMIVTVKKPEQDIEKPIGIVSGSEKWVYPSIEEISSMVLSKTLSSSYEYTYGPRIFNFLNQKNQMDDYVIPLLKQDKTTRRAGVCLYNAFTDSIISNKNIPSLVFIYFKIKNNFLNVSCIVRSNDVFIGWPANLYQIHILQKYVAEKLELKIGEITTFSCSAHVFEEHLEDINKIIKTK